MGADAVGLDAILRRRGRAPAGTTVRRPGVVAPLVLLAVLVAATLWLLNRWMEGSVDVGDGKGMIAVIAAPFLTLWWCWQTLRAVAWRLRGRFSWALSDHELLFVDPLGAAVGPLPLAAITSLTYDIDPSGPQSFAAAIAYRTDQGGTCKVSFPSLEGLDLLQSFARPSDGRAFFEALRERLMRVNPDAQIYPALTSPLPRGRGFR